ncbi:hypothetical protein SAMN05216480_11658 [Pustulibacterium marinum]|uniref:Pycsar effector protein domain-containing protein n=1 Tax=Pustulibacterium marinum TaxID=1224947 RepID=A0A1I7IHP5_9FLAO|nr:Pycsar system effector family protein [Pustulibacterium marinum]SFU72415.1 hypothetical protein SAMN05216480_11658 [Pustulibacterium marinum]
MNLLRSSKIYVNQYYNKNYNSFFLFHNYGLIVQLQTFLDDILKVETTLEKTVIEDLKIALWFHQIGYYEDFENAGNKSISIAEAFLKEQSISVERIDSILTFIKATKLDAVPENYLQKIIQDAAFSFLASKNFDEISTLWKEETNLVKGQEFSKQEWNTYVHSFFTKHHFYSDEALKTWNSQLKLNFISVLKSTKTSKKNKTAKVKKIDKGRDTVFRTTLRNHISLSDNADRKAHIILTVNSIVISIIFSRIFPKLDNPSNAFLYVPSLVFLGFTVASIILSIIATRPRITVGTFTKEQVKNKNVNLLFFGNFYRMKVQEFEWAMEQLLNDDEYIYKSLSKDLYYLGKVVAKKYRILQVTYAVFMIGIIVSSILYIVYFNMYN